MSATQKLLRFGVFELNLDTEALRKSGTLIKLPPQSFQLLVLLALHAGQVVTREEIQKQLWGADTYVDFEHGMNKCIKQIRTALNDNADKPLYVETIPRHGYRFLAQVTTKTMLVPPPTIKESSSGLENKIADRVLARIAAKGNTAQRQALGASVTVAQTATVAPAGSSSPKPGSRTKLLIALLILAAALVAGIFYWRAHRRAPQSMTQVGMSWNLAGIRLALT